MVAPLATIGFSTAASLVSALKGRHSAHRNTGQNLPSSLTSPAGLDPSSPDASGTGSTSGAVSGGGFGQFLKGLDQSGGPLLQAQMAAGTGAQDAVTTAPQGPLASLFAALDGDGDGKVSRSELDAGIKAMQQRSDTPQAAVDSQRLDRIFAAFDSDGSGDVSKDELAAAVKKGHHHHHGRPDHAQAVAAAPAPAPTPAATAAAVSAYDKAAALTSTT